MLVRSRALAHGIRVLRVLLAAVLHGALLRVRDVCSARCRGAVGVRLDDVEDGVCREPRGGAGRGERRLCDAAQAVDAVGVAASSTLGRALEEELARDVLRGRVRGRVRGVACPEGQARQLAQDASCRVAWGDSKVSENVILLAQRSTWLLLPVVVVSFFVVGT